MQLAIAGFVARTTDRAQTLEQRRKRGEVLQPSNVAFLNVFAFLASHVQQYARRIPRSQPYLYSIYSNSANLVPNRIATEGIPYRYWDKLSALSPRMKLAMDLL